MIAVLYSLKCRSMPAFPSGARRTSIAPGAVPLLARDKSSLAALDRSDPQAYVGAAYKTKNAHPAKAGVAKPRVLASSATPEF